MYQYQPNFSPIQVPTRTADGKSFHDVKELFKEPFPPEDHKHFKVGQDKDLGCDAYYVYVPWQIIRNRIDEIVGVECWCLQVVGYFADETGSPVIQGRLNILGVVLEGVGFGKSRGNWQGSKTEIAYADLFKNCAEQFGFCRYLDDQAFTIGYLLQSKDSITKAMANQLMPYFQKKEAQRRRELGLDASGNMLAAEKARSAAKKSQPIPSKPKTPPKQEPNPAETKPVEKLPEQQEPQGQEDYSGLLPWLRHQLLKHGYKVPQERIEDFCNRVSSTKGVVVTSFEELAPNQQKTLLVKICQAFLQEKGLTDDKTLSEACGAIAEATTYADTVSKIMNFAASIRVPVGNPS